MFVTVSTRVNDIPLDAFRVMAGLEETKISIGDDWIWLTFGATSNDVLFFLNKEDSAIYKTEITNKLMKGERITNKLMKGDEAE